MVNSCSTRWLHLYFITPMKCTGSYGLSIIFSEVQSLVETTWLRIRGRVVHDVENHALGDNVRICASRTSV